MTQDEKRVAIAKACGWTKIEKCTCHDSQSRGFPPSFSAHKKHLPDYFNDLNECHEMEKALPNMDDDGIDQLQYSEMLAYTVGAIWSSNNAEDMWRITHATAAQRAEAFGKTLNLW